MPPSRASRNEKLAAMNTIARKQKRQRQQRIPIEPVAQRREAGAFGIGDEARQVPERDRVGRGEAFLDLRGRQFGRQIVGIAMLGRPSAPLTQAFVEMPVCRCRARPTRASMRPAK